MHEAQMHPMNSGVTLTYSPEHLPTDGSLNHRHFELFAKRLRKYYAPIKIRYYMGGEYGEHNGRPHYHAALFGIEFHDATYTKTTPAGSRLYISPTLDQLWGLGQCWTSELNFEYAAYIARYIMAKRTGDAAKKWYERVDMNTGEIYHLKPEYNQPSTNPGLGKHWLDKYESDVYPQGKIVIRGKESNSPRYYDKIYKKKNPDNYDHIKAQRELETYQRRDDNTQQRLDAKEAVANAKIQMFKRTMG